MLSCQRALFPFKDTDTYLNGASRSPQLIAGAQAARRALEWREHNLSMPIPAFFEPVDRLRASFAQLIGGREPGRVALIPSASYGLATVAQNLPVRRGQNIVIVQDQFPSNYYPWQRKCGDTGAQLVTVARPPNRGNWSTAVLEAINRNTAAVAIAHVHWSDGTLFDLAEIRRRTDDVGAWLIVDGTQSIGALPFDVEKIRPDALIAGGYKWLLGPYGCGYAWFGPRMDEGIPLEENWINRQGSDDFGRLAEYSPTYRPLAARYSVGEHSNFLTIPMQQAGLDQLLSWRPERVQEYTQALWLAILNDLEKLGLRMPPRRGHHLVGIRLPEGLPMDGVKRAMEKHDVAVSYRGDVVRVSPNVYNRPEDMQRLLDAFRSVIRI